MIGIVYSTKGALAVCCKAETIHINLHSLAGCYECKRVLTIGEAKAFIEYLSHIQNTCFQCGIIHTVYLSDEARDQLIRDIQNAISRLEADE